MTREFMLKAVEFVIWQLLIWGGGQAIFFFFWHLQCKAVSVPGCFIAKSTAYRTIFIERRKFLPACENQTIWSIVNKYNVQQQLICHRKKMERELFTRCVLLNSIKFKLLLAGMGYVAYMCAEQVLCIR